MLKHLRTFASGDGPILLVSPHPDDETLGAGGFLATQARRGRAVTVVAVTDGEHAYRDYQAPAEGLAEIRTREQKDAVHVLCGRQANLVRFGLTDSAVS